jgi:hypothetical protein
MTVPSERREMRFSVVSREMRARKQLFGRSSNDFEMFPSDDSYRATQLIWA